MNFIEFIGFVVSILAMVYLFIKQAMDQRRRRTDPEAYENEVKEREELIRKLMHGESIHPSAHRSTSTKNGHSHSQQPVIKIPKEMPKKRGCRRPRCPCQSPLYRKREGGRILMLLIRYWRHRLLKGLWVIWIAEKNL